MEAATRAAAKVTTVAVCCGSVRGATEVAVVSGAWAECSGRGGAGGTAAAVAATGAAGKVTAVAVCCGSVRGATKVAVVSGAWAECSGRGGVSGSRLMSGVAHPRPEYPVRELAHPKLEYLARGPAHPSQRQGRGRKGW